MSAINCLFFINCQASVVIEKITNSRWKYLSFAYLQHTVDTGDEYMIHDSFYFKAEFFAANLAAS